MKKRNFKWQGWHINLLAVSVVLMTIIVWFAIYHHSQVKRVDREKYSIVGKGQGIKEAIFIDDGAAVSLSLKNERTEHLPQISKNHVILHDYKLYIAPIESKEKDEYYYLRIYSTKNKKLGQEEKIDLLGLLDKAGYSGIKKVAKVSYLDGEDDVLAIRLKNDKEVYLNLKSKKITRKKPSQAFEQGYETNFGKMQDLTADELELKEPSEDAKRNEYRLAEKRKKFENIYIGYDSVSLDYPDSGEDEDGEYIDYGFHGRSTDNNKVLESLKKHGRIYFLKEKMTIDDYRRVYRWFDSAVVPVWEVWASNSKDSKGHIVKNYQEFLQWIKEEELNEKDN